MKDGLISTADFIALMDYLPTAAGGRSSSAYSGYRGSIRFLDSDIQVPGEQLFLDKEMVQPGDQVTAAIRLSTIQFIAEKMIEGMQFEVLEGSKVVATGKVVEVVVEEMKG